jgi:hypothetical protein
MDDKELLAERSRSIGRAGGAWPRTRSGYANWPRRLEG